MADTVIFPGTFDPVTNGHIDLVQRAASLFEKVIVAVAESLHKSPTFSLEERVGLTKKVFSDLKNVEIFGFNTLLVHFAKAHNASAIVRGLRAVSDFEYEFQLSMMNRRIDSSIETIFLAPAEQFSFISSSLVKEVATLGGDISAFVPDIVANALSSID